MGAEYEFVHEHAEEIDLPHTAARFIELNPTPGAS
jgi:hypothetical protein